MAFLAWRMLGCCLLLAAVTPRVSAIKVLWMGDQGPSKAFAPTSPQPKGSSSKDTDKLLQEAIRNIDQLTNVARSLSNDKMSSTLRAAEAAGRQASAGRQEPVVVQQQAVQRQNSAAQGGSRQGEVVVRVMHDKTQPGDKVCMVGSDPAIGNWKVDKALELKTSSVDFPWWTAKVALNPGSPAEFKFCVKSSGGDSKWEDGANRKCSVEKAGSSIKLEAKFSKSGEKISVMTVGVPPAPAENGLRNQAGVQETGGLGVQRQGSVSRQGSVAPAQRSGGAGGSTRLHFRIRSPTNPGESIAVCGSLPGLGAWEQTSALKLTTSKDDYPFWSGFIEIPIQNLAPSNKYKYLILTSNGQPRWEDQIADRVISPENSARGVLSPNTDTYVDDGSFNKLQRVCTYVRDGKERTRGAVTSPQTQAGGGGAAGMGGSQAALGAGGGSLPDGMQLVSMDQVREWEARLAELEDECDSLRDRAKDAEATVDSLNRDLEEERKQNEDIMQQMAFVEELITRVKRIENQVTTLESTKEVLLTRSESFTDMQTGGDAAAPKSERNVDPGRMAQSIEAGIAGAQQTSIEAGIAGAQQMLADLDKQIPAF